MASKYSKSFKENAVKAYRSSGLTPTEFAFKYGIPDSTFFDWIKKESKEPLWLDVTTEVVKISNVEEFKESGPQSIAVYGNQLELVPKEEIMTMQYGDVVISFHKNWLKDVMEVLHDLEYK